MSLRNVIIGITLLCAPPCAMETYRVGSQTLAKSRAAAATKLKTNIACVAENVPKKTFDEIKRGINKKNAYHREKGPQDWLKLAQGYKRWLTAMAKKDEVPPDMVLGSCANVLDITSAAP